MNKSLILQNKTSRGIKQEGFNNSHQRYIIVYEV